MNNNYNLLSYKSIANQLNNRTYTDYFYRLMLIARSLFKWEGLPNGIDEKWIEKYLFYEGTCVFYKDPNLGFMVTKWSTEGTLNAYDEPTTIRPYATNTMELNNGQLLDNNENCVIIRNNDDMIPTFPTIQLYSADLTNIKRTIDTNISVQKTPTVVTCTDKQKLTFKQAIKQRDENEPVIYGDKNIDINSINVLNTSAPIVFDKLQIQKNNIWNECMTFLGINNANTDKRERLVDDEVQANNQLIKANEDVMLKAREKACELINNMFGLNISVKRRTDLKMANMEDNDDIKTDIDIEEGDI